MEQAQSWGKAGQHSFLHARFVLYYLRKSWLWPNLHCDLFSIQVSYSCNIMYPWILSFEHNVSMLLVVGCNTCILNVALWMTTNVDHKCLNSFSFVHDRDTLMRQKETENDIRKNWKITTKLKPTNCTWTNWMRRKGKKPMKRILLSVVWIWSMILIGHVQKRRKCQCLTYQSSQKISWCIIKVRISFDDYMKHWSLCISSC